MNTKKIITHNLTQTGTPASPLSRFSINDYHMHIGLAGERRSKPLERGQSGGHRSTLWLIGPIHNLIKSHKTGGSTLQKV